MIDNKIKLFAVLIFSASCFLTAFLMPQISNAHALGTNLVQLDITQKSPVEYNVVWSDSKRRLNLIFPSDCKYDGQYSEKQISDQNTVTCASTLNERKIIVEGLKESGLDLMVKILPLNVDTNQKIKVIMLNGDSNIIALDHEPSFLQVAQIYFILGVEHIFGGIDHLLFVLGLLLILTGWKQLAFTITAFTIAHSITLALATFGVIRVPQAPIEVIIALSIVFLATEYARQLNGIEGWTSKRPWLVSFSVGLLHGLGFAGALSEIGLPQADIPLALLTFNLGVEAGQMAFVAGVLLVLGLAVKLLKEIPSWTKVAAAYGIGSIAAFWFLQRTFAMLG